MSTALLIGLAAVIGLFLLVRGKLSGSASMVVTGPGVLKTHNVEARFHSDSGYHGKLGQDRWSDGQERFSLRLNKLAPDHGGKLQLLRNGEQVSEFDVSGNAVNFRWKGITSDAIPKFEIGDEVRVESGSFSAVAIVEAD